MELTAAVVSVNVASMLSKELCYEEIEEIYHTDSTVVLGYINNEARRFHTYVGNRVQYIRDRSDPKQWRYVPGEFNPADEASRGLSATDLLEDCRWFNGPDFLQEATKLMQPQLATSLDPEDREVRKVSTKVLATKDVEQRNTDAPGILETERFKHFSSLTRLKRSIALIQRMLERKRSNKKHNWRPQKGPLTVKEFEEAEILVLRSIQHEHFATEIKIMKKLTGNKDKFQDRKTPKVRNNALKFTSNLFRLDPFLDEKGILRVGGRLKKATTPFAIKHPTIIPRNGHVTTLLVRHHHAIYSHQGYGITHNGIRQAGYWIINGRSIVSHIIHGCVTCRKLRGRAMEQKMADLPRERADPAPPFTYTGMDIFGPFYIKERRSKLKRWGIVFTCLSCRAVHLETLNSMTTDSFLNALRRFVCRRGKVRELRSDQGTNFIGGRNELIAALKELDEDAVQNFLSSKGCDWIKFTSNVPCASHMGGVWERLIRTIRAVLSALLLEHGEQLDDESLRTFMIETENIINSRPLTVFNLTDPETPEPLTPNHLLTCKSQVVLQPPGHFSRPDLYLRRRWRRVQYVTDQFWQRWRTEYRDMLQPRQKWTREHPNAKVGDVVLVRDVNLARNKWPLGRIVKVYPSSDGLVRKARVLITDDGKRSLLDRPIHKLVLICAVDEDEEDERSSDVTDANPG